MMGFGTGLITFLNDDGSPMTPLDIEKERRDREIKKRINETQRGSRDDENRTG